MRTLLIPILFILYGCSNNSDDSQNKIVENISDDSIWCVPIENIAGGTLNFPLIENPQFNSVSEIEAIGILNNSSKVALLKINDQVYVFPYDYTNYYEVINGNFGNHYLAISYCPITESALCFDRKISENETINMKASGYLYKENLVISDSCSKYFWSQMLNEGVKNSSKDIKLNTINIVETRWYIVKNYFQNALVFNHPNLLNCQCDGSIESIDMDNQFGVISNDIRKSVHLYGYDNFTTGTEIKYLNLNGKDIIIIGNKENIFINAFYIPTNLNFETLDLNMFQKILKDNHGNIWDIFGYAVEGPDIGHRLDSPKSYIAAPWAWNEFFDNITVHN
ncbi:MAG TPA: DUF3179 domain-containing (seleno)protein [Flavobacteriaceae bacterium]|nr:DUF3179 domain-containing (seleno)protein [Flavobacteriaceae bacterium]